MLNAEVLRSSFELVVTRSPSLTKRFYEIFFTRFPEVRPMFGASPARQAHQEKMLTDALVAVLDHVEDAPWLTRTLFSLGERHVGYGVRDEMYGWVGECLLATLSEVAGAAWTGEVEKAWTDAFGAIVSLMLDGARAARAATDGGAPTIPEATALAPVSAPV